MDRMRSLSGAKRGPREGRTLPVKLGLGGGLPFLLAAMLLVRPAQAAHDTAPEREAWYLVKQRCYLCHFIDNEDVRWGAKWGPSLKDLFKRQSRTLMNGKPVNDENVGNWIAEGSPNMPAFKHTLSPQQIQLIVTFLKEGGAANVPMIRNSR